MEVLRAVADTPQNGHHGALAALVAITHGAFIADHDGEPGIPLIIPFAGAPKQAGVPAAAAEIDNYRANPLGVYSRGTDGAAVAHNVADSGGFPSPVAGRYSIVGNLFRFTGLTAELPLIQLSEVMTDTGVPLAYEPTVIKLAIPKLLKEGTNLSTIAAGYGRLGAEDLAEIRGGSMVVSPVPDVEVTQKAGA